MAVLMLGLICVACGGSNTPAAATSPSPTVDAANAAYVAMVSTYWDGIVAADNASGNRNEAAETCLGTTSADSPSSVDLVQPARCAVRAAAILAVQRKFLNQVENTPPPQRFRADDTIFETHVPLAIDALKALISATATGSKQATFDAANTYADIMVTTVLPALDDVDPSTKHN